MFAPSRSPTAMWMARSSSRRPQPDSGSACSQSLLWGDVTDSSQALSVALLRLLITVYTQTDKCTHKYTQLQRHKNNICSVSA